MKYIDLTIGALLIIYVCIINKVSSTRVAFSRETLIIGILLIIYHFIKARFKDKLLYKKIMKLMKVVICIGLVCFFALESLIIFYPKKSLENSDYILVLGAGLRGGTEVSLTLKDRLDSAITCYESSNRTSKIVVSGGQGSDEKLSEAEAMKNYLIKNGVEEDNIIKEDKSTNTMENFKFSKEKIQSLGDFTTATVKVVTTDFHGFRSIMIAKRNGYENLNLYTSKTVYYLLPIFYVRESLALVKSFVFDR